MRRRKHADGTHEAIASIADDSYDVGPVVGRTSGAYHDMWRASGLQNKLISFGRTPAVDRTFFIKDFRIPVGRQLTVLES